jgi:para-aminobenzoate synthetase component I
MVFLNENETKAKITDYARGGRPFLFVIDFLKTKGIVLSAEDAMDSGIRFNIQGKTNDQISVFTQKKVQFDRFPMSFVHYQDAFNRVQHHLQHGDTYLLNLTFPTPVTTNLSLEEIFFRSDAPYKLLVNDNFVVFSPEAFIRIENNTISSFPMKGTIDAALPGAEKIILADDKESFEHNTIVDLIRNDLSMVSTKVRVKRFRYIDRIVNNNGELLQVSSEITGLLTDRWRENLGDILFALLPAGSVTGAPKEKTVQIIRETEPYQRGFYTGVFGYFDGSSLDSAVMIRFIENTGNGMAFKSGGGITALSAAKSEYEEMIQKVYVPVV